VHQVGHLPELYEDAWSENIKKFCWLVAVTHFLARDVAHKMSISFLRSVSVS